MGADFSVGKGGFPLPNMGRYISTHIFPAEIRCSDCVRVAWSLFLICEAFLVLMWSSFSLQN